MVLLFKTFLLYIINNILFKCIKLIIFKKFREKNYFKNEKKYLNILNKLYIFFVY